MPCRTRSSGRWRAFDSFEGRVLASFLALPDCDERLSRHAGRARAARPADGPRAGAGADRGEPEHAPRGDLDPADAGRPGRGRCLTGDDPARARRGPPASTAPPARGPDPLRGAALEGRRGRGAARDERRVREQRAPARPRNARGERPDRGRRVAVGRRGGRRAPRALRRGLRALRHGRAHVA